MKPEAIRSVAAVALDHWEIVASAIDPSYELSGNEVVMLNPNREDRTRKSFSFNRRKGVWKENADDGAGGADLVGLWHYCKRLPTMSAAAVDLASHLGLSLDALPDAAPERKQEEARPLEPVPDVGMKSLHATMRAIFKSHATAHWIIKDTEGRPLMARVRVEEPGRDKEVKPLTWNTKAGRWKVGGSWMLYHLEALKDRPAAPVVMLEGEKSTDAAVKLFPDHVAIGFPGVGCVRKVDLESLQGREIIIFPDADEPGFKAARTLAGRLAQMGARVHIVDLPAPITEWVKPGKDHPGGWDVADPLPDGLQLADLHKLLDDAKPYASSPVDQGTARTGGPYKEEHGCTWYEPPDKKPLRLANFTARICEEITKDDGAEESKVFVIEGRRATGETLRRVEVPSAQFGGMSWITNSWPIGGAILSAANGCQARFKEALQTFSDPIPRTVYSHLGWRKIEGRWVYLHTGGAIGSAGAVPGLEVDPVEKLASFTFPDTSSADLVPAIRASLSMLDLAPLALTVPVFLACYRAPMGRASFGLHLTGETGSRKSCLQAIAQSHWGTSFRYDNLPGQWSATRTALEVLTFQAKDALICIDDLAPQPSRHEREKLFATVEHVIRALGNGAGRDRCNDAANLKASRPPRGLILSSGEDLPQGHSARARVLILEVKPKEVDTDKLTELQAHAKAGKLASSMAGYLRWLAPQMDGMTSSLDDRIGILRPRFQGCHGRTTDAAASLFIGGESFLRFALEAGAIDKAEAGRLERQFLEALQGATATQAEAQAAADPVRRFLDLLPAVFTSGRAHLEGIKGREPHESFRFGWVKEPRAQEGFDMAPQGHCIGWYDEEEQIVFLEDAAAFATVDQLASANGEPISMSKGILWKRLAERGKILRDADGKHLKRKVPGQGNQRALAFKLASVPTWEPEEQADSASHFSDDSHLNKTSGKAETRVIIGQNPQIPKIPKSEILPPPLSLREPLGEVI